MALQDPTAAPPKPGMIGRLAKAARYLITGDDFGSKGDFFGPGQPMRPMGPVESEGRKFDYMVGTNIQLATKTVDQSVSFQDLQNLAEYHDVTRLLIETRKDQLEALEWTIRPKKFRGEEVDEIAPNVQDRIDDSLIFFSKPDGVNSFATWLRLLIDDLLVIDAPTVYVNTENPLSWKFEIVSGATIKRLITQGGRTPEPPDPAYQQMIKGLPAWDYTTEDLIYMPRNPRPHKLYGMSPVQQIIILINIALRREASQLEYYTEGNIPDALISVPKEWTPEQIATYQQYWDSLNAGNTAERRRAKFVPGGTSVTQTRTVNLKDEFDDYLIRIACFAFSIPPTAFIKTQNRSTAQTAKAAAEEEGLAPLMKWVKQLMDECLFRLGQKDLEFVYIQNEEQDAEVQVALLDREVRNGTMTINEAREARGRDPIEGGDVAMIYMGTQPIPVNKAAEGPPEPPPMLPGKVPGAQGTAGNGKAPGGGNANGKGPAAVPATDGDEGAGKDGKPPAGADAGKVAKAELGDLKPLVIKRRVENAGEIIDWARGQGFTATLPADDMHCTLVYCKDPVDWEAIPDHVSSIVARGAIRSVELLGEPIASGAQACVLKFRSKRLELRWQELQDLGVKSNYDKYLPHVTIAYDGAPADLDQVVPYEGPIVLGEELFKEAKANWAEGIKEQEVGKATHRPFVFRFGIGTRRYPFVFRPGIATRKGYNPDQPRDERGRWGEGSGASDAEAAKELGLKGSSIELSGPSVISPVEAKDFVADSKIQYPSYRFTTEAGAERMAREGFERKTGGTTWQGTGVYTFVHDPGKSDYGDTKLELVMDVRNPFIGTDEEIEKKIDSFGLQAPEYMLPNGEGTGVRIWPSNADKQNATRDAWLAAGHDAVVMLDTKGGSPSIIGAFKPDSIRIVNKLEPDRGEPSHSGGVRKYDPSQPRDEQGRWADDGGAQPSDQLKEVDARAFSGKQVETETTMSKQAAGALGEKIALAYLQKEGMTDARALNVGQSNFPVDAVGDHELIEVKTGLVSNGPGAQQWRATIGQPGPKETAWLKTASAEDKRVWNEAKQAAIIDRKNEAVKEFSQRLGQPIAGKTLTLIINPDTKTADVHMFDGFHSRIGWNSEQAKAAYKGTFSYE